MANEFHNKPFSSINDSSIAIYIQAKYKNCKIEDDVFKMINKFFKSKFR
jgi:hypothetical protein